MTDTPDDHRVGYGKPPKHTRWKKGQSGNPRKRRRPPTRSKNMAAIIDRFLEEPVQVVINGTPTRISAVEAIVQNLLQKWLSGNGKALCVLLEYREYFQRRQPARPSKVVFLDPDRTHELSAEPVQVDDV